MTNSRTSFNGRHATGLVAACTLGLLISGLLPGFAAPTAHEGASPSDADLLAAAGRQLATVTQQVMPSVVKIRCRKPSSGRATLQETGSGVIVQHRTTGRPVVVTNAHVIAGRRPTDLRIHLYDGRIATAVRTWSDPASDLAVVALEAGSLTAAQWGDSDQLQIGHFVLAAGSPFDLNHSVTLGIISAKGRRSLKIGRGDVINQDFLQTDAAINPGNSGGPLLDTRGRVIGINTAIATTNGHGSGVGFSIPSRLAQRVVDDLLTHGTVRRAYLGVVLDPEFTLAEARQLGLDRKGGARITSIASGTPAARARLQVNDVVTSFQNAPVHDFDHLVNLVSLQPIGSQVTLEVWRNRRSLKIRVSLSDRAQID